MFLLSTTMALLICTIMMLKKDIKSDHTAWPYNIIYNSFSWLIIDNWIWADKLWFVFCFLFLILYLHLKHGFFLDQNFLYTSKDENSKLKAIDFGLSDFVKPGLSIHMSPYLLPIFQPWEFQWSFNAYGALQMKGLMTLSEVHITLPLKFYIGLIVQRLMYGV